MATMQFAVGKCCWAKVGDWPWWPAQVVPLERVPEKVRVLMEGRTGHVVKFFEDPPKYQVLSEKQLHPWREHYAKHSQTKSKPFARSLAEANDYYKDLSDALKEDGVPNRVEKPKRVANKKTKQPAGEKRPLVDVSEALLKDGKVILEARRALAVAILDGDAGRLVAAIEAMEQLQYDERIIRELQLGKVATLLSAHANGDVAKAARELVAVLVAAVAAGQGGQKRARE